jgi:hypothetical protein
MSRCWIGSWISRSEGDGRDECGASDFQYYRVRGAAHSVVRLVERAEREDEKMMHTMKFMRFSAQNGRLLQSESWEFTVKPFGIDRVSRVNEQTGQLIETFTVDLFEQMKVREKILCEWLFKHRERPDFEKVMPEGWDANDDMHDGLWSMVPEFDEEDKQEIRKQWLFFDL